MGTKFEDECSWFHNFDSSTIAPAYARSMIFQANDQYSYAREPVLRRMPDGSLVCFIFSGGRREPSTENCILLTRSDDDGATWSQPSEIFHHSMRSTWATELSMEGEYPTVYLHTFLFDTYYYELKTYQSQTRDNGKTWSEPKSIAGVPPSVIVRKIITLANGDLIMPVYWTESLDEYDWGKFADLAQNEGAPMMFKGAASRFVCGVLRSSNKGMSWSLHGYLDNPMVCPDNWWRNHFWEPGVVELSDGHLRMYIRNDGAGVLWQSDSIDGGLTWSEASKTDIPNPGTKFDILKIRNKVLLLNNFSASSRNPLSIWVSSDHCRSWDVKLEIGRTIDDRPWCYPHAFADDQAELLYVASDAFKEHYLQKIPYADLML